MTHKKNPINVAMVGAGMIDFGELFHKSLEDMIFESYESCLKSVDKGIDEGQIEAAWFGSCLPGTSVRKEIISGATISDAISFLDKPVTRVENACCTGSDAIRNAAFAVKAGIYDVVLVVGAEKMRDIPSRDSMIGQANTLYHLWWHPRGLTAPGMYGQFGVAHMNKYGTRKEHFAMVAVKNHHNGTMDPYSHFKFEVTLEQVMKAPMVTWPLGLLDCCPTTDGAAAVILVREDMAREFTDRPVYLLGSGLSCDNFYTHFKRHYHQWDTTTNAANDAYKMAGITADDVDVAEVHDCFTCTELLSYEDLGFCPRGKAGDWIEKGGPMLDGELPCNTSGGLKSKGHPIGATGVAQACEIFWQLRGEAGKRQAKDVHVGLTHNLGGTGSVALVNLYGNQPG